MSSSERLVALLAKRAAANHPRYPLMCTASRRPLPVASRALVLPVSFWQGTKVRLEGSKEDLILGI